MLLSSRQLKSYTESHLNVNKGKNTLVHTLSLTDVMLRQTRKKIEKDRQQNDKALPPQPPPSFLVTLASFG
jgi:hypothetical protein